MDLRPLLRESDTRIVLVVADGLGGIGRDGRGTELEAARTPHLDRLAREGVTGMVVPVLPGITPGSGPGHLALFGHDPVEHHIGRGVLTALGVDFELRDGDVAARGNFCTIDENGMVTDRRAGRISSETGARLVRKLQSIDVDGVEVIVEPVREYRFLLVLRGDGLGVDVTDTDPQQTGVEPQRPRAENDRSGRTAKAVASFVDQAREILADETPANMVLMRGFESLPRLEGMEERYGLRSCALAGYPMYRGIARLLGMDVVDCGPDLDSEIDALQAQWKSHDFFFLHYKDADSAGEDGDFAAKVEAIERLDEAVPRIVDLGPDVLIVTGDHSTPSELASHSWHPVPVLLSARSCRRDSVDEFGESACVQGGLGQMPAKDLMALALAHAGRLQKYGA